MSPTRIRNAKGELLEAGWSRQVEELARLGGWAYAHMPDNRPGRKTGRPQRVVGDTVGFPDLILIRRAELIVAELKTDKGRLGPGQQDWLDRFKRAGDAVCRMVDGNASAATGLERPVIEAHVWRPRDIEAVQARLVGPGVPDFGRIHEPKEGR